MKREHIVKAIALAIEAKESYVDTLTVVDEIMGGELPYVALKRAMPDAEWMQAVKNIEGYGSRIIWLACMAEKLCGYTISETTCDPQGERWGLLLTHPDKDSVVAWVSSDEEGNGPGFLDIQPEV